MPEYTVTDMEVVKEMPGNPQEKGGPAKVLRLSLEEDPRQPELFTVASTPLPTVGEKYEGTIEDSPYGPKFKRPGGKAQGAGFKRSPADTKAIQRQHSQQIALMKEANIIASGGRPFTHQEMVTAIDYFEDDIKGKAGTRGFIREDDVPFDNAGMEDEVPFK